MVDMMDREVVSRAPEGDGGGETGNRGHDLPRRIGDFVRRTRASLSSLGRDILGGAHDAATDPTVWTDALSVLEDGLDRRPNPATYPEAPAGSSIAWDTLDPEKISTMPEPWRTALEKATRELADAEAQGGLAYELVHEEVRLHEPLNLSDGHAHLIRQLLSDATMYSASPVDMEKYKGDPLGVPEPVARLKRVSDEVVETTANGGKVPKIRAFLLPDATGNGTENSLVFFRLKGTTPTDYAKSRDTVLREAGFSKLNLSPIPPRPATLPNV